ncbi:GntR family transcriptional regulator [Amycolatopsis anabasis]|uniref:GntR family transcriptional regulator n=1 Tax=Amycolatopsis anabasis TaxID=1840409 RepID=UPI00131C9D02|nr:GntR family transcriptional regulator [Amycolatopsis anabasis]
MTTSGVRRAQRRGLAQEAADRIRDAIFAGVFSPGAALREVELAASLDVSRGSVREGLAELQREGLVRTAWHRGTRVIDLTEPDVREVYAVRAALDRLAAVTAAGKASPAELARLDEIVEKIASELDSGADGNRLLALDLEFHDLIYAAAGNQRLVDAWYALRSQVHLFQSVRVRRGHEHYRERVVDEHRELVSLLRQGDLDRLARAAEDHVDSARDTLLTLLTR